MDIAFLSNFYEICTINIRMLVGHECTMAFEISILSLQNRYHEQQNHVQVSFTPGSSRPETQNHTEDL